MRISPDMLRRGLLEQGVAVTVFGNVGGALDLSRVMFAEPGGAFEDGVVYLVDGAPGQGAPGQGALGQGAAGASGRGGDHARRKIQSVALVSGSYDVAFIRRFQAVFIADDPQPLAALHNKAQRVFEHYDVWSDELRRLLNTGSNVQAMIDVGTHVMGNPLILQDSNFSVIAVSSDYAGSPSLEPILDQNSVPYFMMSERGPASGVGASGDSGVIPLKVTGRHALYTNIFQQGRFQYRLLVLEMGEELHASASALLEFISGYIQLAIGFVVDEAKESHELPFVIKNVLTGEYRDEGFIESRLSEFGWLPRHRCVCVQIRAELPDYRNRTMRFMTDRLRAVFKDACVFEFENNIAAFFDLTREGAGGGTGQGHGGAHGAQGGIHAERGAGAQGGIRAGLSSDMDAAEEAALRGVQQALAGFLQDNQMKAGFSNVFSGFADLRQHYTQAGVAIRLGPRLKPYQWLHRFGDVKELYILERCAEELPARMVCDPGLMRLREYDAEHKQELYRTLHVYLKNNRSAVAAAKELYIHRSTFLYRLDRIREITGMTLDKAAGDWYLLLSYELLDRMES